VVFQEIYSPQAGWQLHVIIVTIYKRVFRYSFPHPSTLVRKDAANSYAPNELYTDSIFNVPVPKSETAEPGILLTSIASHAEIEMVVPIHYPNDAVVDSSTATDGRYFAVGCSDGTIVVVDMFSIGPNGDRATEIELSAGGSWWNSLTKVVGSARYAMHVILLFYYLQTLCLGQIE